jgi:regulator of replication initiation timing
MDTTDRIKQEMSRWSSEIKDRVYFEAKINAFLKNEVTRLENEVFRLRLENDKLKSRIEEMSGPKVQQIPYKNHDLEID